MRRAVVERTVFDEMRSDARGVLDVSKARWPWAFGALPYSERDLAEAPSRLLSQNLTQLGDVQGKVFLDAGSGLGRDTLFLLRRGAEVYSVDMNMHALDFQHRWAARLELPGKLWTVVAGMENFSMDVPFDGVISNLSLGRMRTDRDALDFIHYAQAHTRKGGMNLVAAFTPENKIINPSLFGQATLLTADETFDWYFGSWMSRRTLSRFIGDQVALLSNGAIEAAPMYAPVGRWEDINSHAREELDHSKATFPVPEYPEGINPKRIAVQVSARKK
ncbi:Tellurite resistance protein TehB [uncultured archaeon]|nr:Tellurite resistance protein TehB [uncultured archaeon]